MLVYTYKTSLLPVFSSYYSADSHIYGILGPYRVNLHRFVLLLREAGKDIFPHVFHFQPPFDIVSSGLSFPINQLCHFYSLLSISLLSLTSRDLFELTENHVSTFP